MNAQLEHDAWSSGAHGECYRNLHVYVWLTGQESDTAVNALFEVLKVWRALCNIAFTLMLEAERKFGTHAELDTFIRRVGTFIRLWKDVGPKDHASYSHIEGLPPQIGHLREILDCLKAFKHHAKKIRFRVFSFYRHYVRRLLDSLTDITVYMYLPEREDYTAVEAWVDAFNIKCTLVKYTPYTSLLERKFIKRLSEKEAKEIILKSITRKKHTRTENAFSDVQVFFKELYGSTATKIDHKTQPKS